MLQRAAGTIVYASLMGVIGAALGLALRSQAAAVVTALVVLLALDPLFAGLLDAVAQWGPGGAAGALTGSGAEEASRRPGRAGSRSSSTPGCSVPRPRR